MGEQVCVEYAALRAEAERSSTDDQALVSRPELRHLLAAYDELREQAAAPPAKPRRRMKAAVEV